jgi:hypothetical protein
MKQKAEAYRTVTIVPSTLKLNALKEPTVEPYVPLYNRGRVPNRPEPKPVKKWCECVIL